LVIPESFWRMFTSVGEVTTKLDCDMKGVYFMA
jgi:hypothetical protein